MLRIISLFLLLIISRMSFSSDSETTISASSASVNVWKTVAYNSYGSTEYTSSDNLQGACDKFSANYLSYANATGNGVTYSLIAASVGVNYGTYFKCTASTLSSLNSSGGKTMNINLVAITQYSCLSGYTQSDSAGNADSSGHYCTKNSCQDLYQTTSMIDIPPRQTVTNACFNGCSATSMLGTWVCDSDTACSIRVSFDGNSCSGGVDYAANASSSDSGTDSGTDSSSGSDGCGAAGTTTGTVNGESVTTCTDDGTDSSPGTDGTSSGVGTDGTSSGLGTDAGSPETNTSGTQTGTVGGGTDGLGGDGYGEGGSAGSSGTDSGGTSGTGTDSGGTSGTDSGGTSGTDSGGTSGTDSGGTSGADSGGTSGSGSGSDSGTGTATSGAGDTDSDTPAEEEEESGDGGGTFAAPGEGTDYLKDVFGESDLASLATDNAELTAQINQKMADVKGIFNLGTLSVSGDMPENQQEIKGASVDLSGRNIFEQLSIVAAALYLCAIATAIYIVMGGRK